MYDFIPPGSSIGTAPSAGHRSAAQRLGVETGLHYVVSRHRSKQDIAVAAHGEKNEEQNR
jgi:hypothetical protein